MLKKAGFVAASSIASLLVASPLAFAGGTGEEEVKGENVTGGSSQGDGHGGGHGHHDGGDNQNSKALINVLNGNNLDVPIQACNNDLQGQVGLVPVQDIAENPTATGQLVAGLLGNAGGDQRTDVDNTRSCGQGTGGAGYGNH